VVLFNGEKMKEHAGLGLRRAQCLAQQDGEGGPLFPVVEAVPVVNIFGNPAKVYMNCKLGSLVKNLN
jgi:hypothetical protein